MSEPVEFKGHRYRIGQLDCFKQFHVVRRLAPIIAQIVQTSDGTIKPVENGEGAEKFFEQMAGPIANAFASMSDETAEYIIHTCLSVVEREVSKQGAWAPILTKKSSALMYEDIDLSTMIGLTVNVIQENMSGFFSFAELKSVAGISPTPPA